MPSRPDHGSGGGTRSGASLGREKVDRHGDTQSPHVFGIGTVVSRASTGFSPAAGVLMCCRFPLLLLSGLCAGAAKLVICPGHVPSRSTQGPLGILIRLGWSLVVVATFPRCFPQSDRASLSNGFRAAVPQRRRNCTIVWSGRLGEGVIPTYSALLHDSVWAVHSPLLHGRLVVPIGPRCRTLILFYSLPSGV